MSKISATIIPMFHGISSIARMSEKTNGNGDFRLKRASSKTGMKNTIADETRIRFGINSFDFFLFVIAIIIMANIVDVNTYVATIGTKSIKDTAAAKLEECFISKTIS